MRLWRWLPSGALVTCLTSHQCPHLFSSILFAENMAWSPRSVPFVGAQCISVGWSDCATATISGCAKPMHLCRRLPSGDSVPWKHWILKWMRRSPIVGRFDGNPRCESSDPRTSIRWPFDGWVLVLEAWRFDGWPRRYFSASATLCLFKFVLCYLRLAVLMVDHAVILRSSKGAICCRQNSKTCLKIILAPSSRFTDLRTTASPLQRTQK